MRPSRDTFKDGFRLVLLALETLVQAAIVRVVKVLVTQITKEALIKAIPHGRTRVLVPEKRTRFGESQVLKASMRISNSSLLDALFGYCDHIGAANQHCQISRL
jgi:hypothetical protein